MSHFSNLRLTVATAPFILDSDSTRNVQEKINFPGLLKKPGYPHVSQKKAGK